MSFSHGLTQVVKEFTRIQGDSKSILDLFFLSDSMMLYPYECRVLPGISDHLMVVLSLYLNDNPSARYEVTTYKDFSHADDVAILDMLDSSYDAFHQSSLDRKVNVNQLWQKFKGLATHCIAQHVPEKVNRNRTTNPWITRDVIHQKRKVSRCRLQVRKSQADVVRDKLRCLSKDLKSMIKKAKYYYFNVTMTGILRHSPKRFWKHLSPRKPGVTKLVTDDRVVSEKTDIANVFGSFFSTVFSCDDGTLPE